MRQTWGVFTWALLFWAVSVRANGIPEFFSVRCAPRVYTEATLTRTLRGLDAERRAWVERGRYKGFSMSTHELKQDMSQGVTYLDDEQREYYRVHFCRQPDGEVRFCHSDGRLIDTRVAQAYRSDRGYRALFVMGLDGAFYVSSYQKDREFHHSSFFGDALVAAAGEVEIIDGVMNFLGDRTGHFPYADIFLQAIFQLEVEGVNLIGIDIGRWSAGESSYTYARYVPAPLDRH
ncbi:MAG: hypothetical protein KDD51_07315 [Bdellovibrionales bacterium]|nr:hypothetical protein [Bdellovibrionales bacterium]